MSSSELAVRVRDVGKMYTIVHNAQKENSLFATVGNRLRNPFRRAEKEQFWALRDVSFDITKGEVVGFIGRNGAGKSTLLKVLSRITEPTTGQIDLYGRVGSLLEVGTGFHPELTGRENIYLNGGILGMSRREIARHFDEIVDFAGTEKFLDTPVKRYSSGMFVRLAFAVAAHLNPEILIIDEVLSVGDAEFQKKCLGKMRDVAESGRTVLFVSHNMGTVQALCARSILLRNGSIALDGDTDVVVDRYLRDMESVGTIDTAVEEREGTGAVRVTGVRLLNAAGVPGTTAIAGSDLTLELDYVNPGELSHPKLLVNLYNDQGIPVSSVSTELTNPHLSPLHPAGRFSCRLPRLPLLPGRYRVAVAVQADGQSADYLPAALVFEVATSKFFESGRVPRSDVAAFMLDHAWEHRALDVEVRNVPKAGAGADPA